MLYRLLLKSITADIENGTVDYEGTMQKLDVFYAKGRLTTEQYLELVDMLEPYKPVDVTEK